MRYCYLTVLFILLLLISNSSDGQVQKPSEGPAKSVRIQLHWIHQAQFAGFYVAKDKGFYQRRGLSVELLRGGPEIDPIAAISGGSAEFCTCFLTGAIIDKEKGCDLVHVGQVVNMTNLMLVARKKLGVCRPQDLSGRRVSLWGEHFRAAFLGFFEAQGVKPVVVPQYASVNLFLRGGVDACAAMEYNEQHLLYQAGMDQDEMTCFFMRDYGLGFPEDGIYCMRDMAEKDMKLCKDISEATIEGWEYASRHKKEALDITMRYVLDTHVPTNRSHMAWMLNRIIPSILAPEKGGWTTGVLSRRDYESAVSQMVKSGFVRGAARFEAFSLQGEGFVE